MSWLQIGPDKMLGLIWRQAVCHCVRIPEISFETLLKKTVSEGEVKENNNKG